ncbi:uncharacterized protein EI97DRAFT_432983 [Westerdykella ornata]|uniref:Ubiquitin 3 binding protein But2 C-terminal domain-containing protein n=1 Tax=Westerdykella ornata TaxID=318751 RepID=A0A6A6JJC0_WESOR|nr:uncharacterized protein EI97DRAFT_432983 [Westerdykella ornata]KAF2276740.1 hypothetical protein EI97DRAFT_432983 [Westerdykella ornata]
MRPNLTHSTTLLLLSATALAAPLATRTQSWPIPSLEVHFMGHDSGLPGGQWPEAHKFNSSLAFTIAVAPNSPSIPCRAPWPEKEIPTTPLPCDADGFEFQLSPTSSGLLTETSFVLTVRKMESDP